MKSRFGFIGFALAVLSTLVPAATAYAELGSRAPYTARAAVLELGTVGALRAEVARNLATAGMVVVTGSLADAAARGVGYDGSLNPGRDEVRRLSAAIGCEVLVFGTSSVVERESPDPDRRWDGFAGLFLVDGRTGSLLRYRGVSVFASGRDTAERQLIRQVSGEVGSWSGLVGRVDGKADAGPYNGDFVDLVATPDGTPDVIPPRFFSRPVPAYTADADRAHASATVELIVEFLADGTYGRVDIHRWAGFGLDESAVQAVRSSKFWPARRKGELVRCRAMLRFNFRFRGDGQVVGSLR